MEDKEIEYTEVFERTTTNPDYVIEQVIEAHSPEYGWEVSGEIDIQDLGNGEYKVFIPLTKYRTNTRGK